MASTFPPLLEVTTDLGAQEIMFIVDTGAAVSIIPKEYLANTVLNSTNIALVFCKQCKNRVPWIDCSNRDNKKNLRGKISREHLL